MPVSPNDPAARRADRVRVFSALEGANAVTYQLPHLAHPAVAPAQVLEGVDGDGPLAHEGLIVAGLALPFLVGPPVESRPRELEAAAARAILGVVLEAETEGVRVIHWHGPRRRARRIELQLAHLLRQGQAARDLVDIRRDEIRDSHP